MDGNLVFVEDELTVCEALVPRGSNRLPLVAVATLVVVCAIVLPASPALAACHAFVVTASPETVDEGGSVTITVSRDAAVAPSSIDVETIDETATAGPDYAGVARRTIAFTNDVQQTLTVATVDDPDTEGPETFRVHLSNPGGCVVNPNFSVGPDARVTIAGGDTPAPTQPPPPPPTTVSAATTTAPTVAGSTTTVTTVPTTIAGASSTSSTLGGSTSTSGTGAAAAAADDGSDGLSAGVLVLAILLVLAAGAAVFTVYRRQGT